MRALAICLSLAMATGASVGCATDPQSGPEGVGELQIPLTTTGNDGSIFRLDARFVVTDVNTGQAQVIDGSGDSPSLAVSVASGAYTVAIADDFQLSRSRDGVSFQAVPAVLGSQNPVTTFVSPGAATSVFFFFLVANDGPDQNATILISFGVSPRRGQLVATLFVNAATGVFAPYLGAPAPSFTAPYVIGGEGVFSERRVHEFFSGPVGMTVTSDTVGVLRSLAPAMTGGFLLFRFEARADDSQRFSLNFQSSSSGAFSQLIASSEDLQPRVSVNPMSGIPNDPVLSSFRTTVSFLLESGLGGNTMTGDIDLQFAP
jgi:hypothetical protein